MMTVVDARGRMIAWACAALVLSSASGAAASEPASARLVRVVVEPSPACPSTAAFPDRLRDLSADIRVAAQWVAAPTVHVRVEQRGDELHGVLRVEQRGGDDVVREVSGASCHDIVEALALMAAVQIAPSAPRSPSFFRLSPSPTAAASWWTYGVGMGAAWMDARDMPAFGGLRGWVQTRRESPRLWSPTFRVAFSRLNTGTVRVGSADSAFSLTTVQAVACPLRWPTLGPVSFEPCLGLAWGRLHGTATGVAQARSDERDWAAIGVGLRGALRPLGPLVVAGEASWDLPLIRYRFYLDPGPTLLSVPSQTVGAGICVGLQFD